jgi:hypothetical protein
MNLKDLRDALKLVRGIAKANTIAFEKAAEVILSWEDATATERSTKDERLAVMDALREFVAANPEGAFDPRQVVVQVGLKQCQADRAFVRHHITKLRIASAA